MRGLLVNLEILTPVKMARSGDFAADNPCLRQAAGTSIAGSTTHWLNFTHKRTDVVGFSRCLKVDGVGRNRDVSRYTSHDCPIDPSAGLRTPLWPPESPRRYVLIAPDTNLRLGGQWLPYQSPAQRSMPATKQSA